MAEVLQEEYMSSEESQYETDSEGKVNYVVRELSWESEKLSRRKQKLDREYGKSQTKRSRSQVHQRLRDGVDFSYRPCSNNCPKWAQNSDSH